MSSRSPSTGTSARRRAPAASAGRRSARLPRGEPRDPAPAGRRGPWLCPAAGARDPRRPAGARRRRGTSVRPPGQPTDRPDLPDHLFVTWARSIRSPKSRPALCRSQIIGFGYRCVWDSPIHKPNLQAWHPLSDASRGRPTDSAAGERERRGASRRPGAIELRARIRAQECR
jgi:hypothetical protein